MKIVYFTVFLLTIAIFSFLGFRSEHLLRPPVPLEGIVTAKEWIPAHDDMYFMSIPDGNGSLIQIPQWTHTDDQWRIYVGSRYARVTKETFKKIEVQQHFREQLE